MQQAPACCPLAIPPLVLQHSFTGQEIFGLYSYAKGFCLVNWRLKYLTILTCQFILVSYVSFAQEKGFPELLEANNQFFSTLRENVHLHLNKTTYTQGEHIWYAAYVYDQNSQQPSLTTTNLYVALVDHTGNQITKQLIHIENGIGHGDIKLENELSSSKYFLFAWTSWMKNFDDVQPFVQEIKLLNSGGVTIEPEELQPLVEITPEGGRILAGTKNTIGFQIKIPPGEKSAVSSVTLIDDEGIVVVDNLAVNEAGQGEVRYFHKPNDTYSLQVQCKNGIIIEEALPTSVDKGIKMEAATANPNFAYVTITTDSTTLEKLKRKPVYLAIRQNDEMDVTEHFLNSQTTLIKVLKSSLYEGINILTLFNSDFLPVSERLIFNDLNPYVSNDFLEVSGNRISDPDLLQLIFKAGDKLDSLLTVSVSVLPFNSFAYNPQNNLISSFKLKPYVDHLEIFDHLFRNEFDRRNSYSFDISLLNNGSGRYPWTTIVAEKTDLSYPFENGIQFKGRIIDADLIRENKVWLFTEQSNNGFYTDLNIDKTFSGTNILFSGDSLRISIFGEKGNLRKPKAEIEFGSMLEKDSLKYSRYLTSGMMGNVALNSVDRGMTTMPDNKIPDSSKTIFLDEVVVTDRNQNTRNIRINSALDSGKGITDEDIKRNVTVVNYLKKLGYKIVINEGSVDVLSKTIPPGAFSYVPVPVIIGGMLIDGGELLLMPLHRVQSIFYDDMGYRYISLTPYPGHNSEKNRVQYLSLPITNGFTIPGEYFDPGYSDLRSNEFIRYGVVRWLPEVTLGRNESAKVTIPRMAQTRFLLYIEGMDSDGNLISKKEIIELSENTLGN